MTAYNTFDNPELVNVKEFNDFVVTETGINFTIPKCSVMRFIVE